MRLILTLLILSICSSLIAQVTSGYCYEDRDGDGYGNPAAYVPKSGTTGCDFSGVDNNLDCNDADKTINPNTVWYRDADGDGYHNGTSVQMCDPGALYYQLSKLKGGGDCNDTDPFINPATLWYQDKDGDGSVNMATILKHCTRPTGNYFNENELSEVYPDCNDEDFHERFGQHWYTDSDGDGYPASLHFVELCSRPNGLKAATELVSTTLVDCDDNNKSITSPATWYRDSDGDAYTDGSYLIQCTDPGSGYTTTPQRDIFYNNLKIDCNDNDPVQHPGQTWYRDDDGDKHGRDFLLGGILIQCERPIGTFAESELLSIKDCNDADAEINPFRRGTFGKDSDNDGYASQFSTFTEFYFCSVPDGWKLLSSLKEGDCNDWDAAINPETVWYLDADNDGYGRGDQFPVVAVQCNRPAGGYKLESELQRLYGDCDDNDPDITPLTLWAKDADNDKYYTGTPIKLINCLFAPNYKPLSKLTGGDDCDDDNPAINAATDWFEDADNDGYANYTGTNIPLQQCTRPAGAYKLSSELQGYNDCNDTDPNVTPTSLWAYDVDNDGYYTGTPFSTPANCIFPAGGGHKLVSTLIGGGDCNDNNNAFNPGAPEKCNGLDDDCDSQIDEDKPAVNLGSDRTLYFAGGTLEFEGFSQCATLTPAITGGAELYSYSWSNGASTQSITVCPSATTSYTVTVTDQYNCTVSDEVVINVIDVRCGKKLKDILVCHSGKTICMVKEDVPAHLKHGDVLGPCISSAITRSAEIQELQLKNGAPEVYKLSTYPNPANDQIRFTFELPAAGKISLQLYNVSGRQIATVLQADKQAGVHTINFNSSNLKAGVYYFTFTSTHEKGTYRETKKLMIIH